MKDLGDEEGGFKEREYKNSAGLPVGSWDFPTTEPPLNPQTPQTLRARVFVHNLGSELRVDLRVVREAREGGGCHLLGLQRSVAHAHTQPRLLGARRGSMKTSKVPVAAETPRTPTLEPTKARYLKLKRGPKSIGPHTPHDLGDGPG